MGVGRAEAKVNATQTASAGGQDAGRVADHLNGVGHTMPVEEGGEDGTGGANLLRLTEALTHEPPNTTIRITLGRVMVGDKARKRAEPGAESEVQGVAAVAKVGSKEVLSRLVDETINEVDVNRNGGVRRKSAAEAIDAGEATSDNKARTAHSQ